jgi:hypothetical protein
VVEVMKIKPWQMVIRSPVMVSLSPDHALKLGWWAGTATPIHAMDAAESTTLTSVTRITISHIFNVFAAIRHPLSQKIKLILETKTLTLETKTLTLETKTLALETKTSTLETKTLTLETKTLTLEAKALMMETTRAMTVELV